MRLSETFAKTLKNAPKDAETVNHKLLLRAGFVRQLMAGVYTYLPLGLRVLNKISQVIREEMNAIGGQEVLMPMMHPASNWKATGGWDKIDVLFKVKSRTKKDYALAQSNEETVTPLAKEFLRSYKDLPLSIYHINWKFRDELRSKSGILRGREFLMKDLYSFHIDQEDFERYYKISKTAYLKVFERFGLTAKVTEASGGGFTEKVSYEFEVLSDAGEANILYCDKCDYCVNTDDIDKYKNGDKCPACKKDNLKPAKASEVGNVFDLGQKYTRAFGLIVSKKDGGKVYPIMGCYGIGISRTMGVIVEKFHDEKGIIWPKEVSPFDVHLVELPGGKGKEVYDKLKSFGIDVLWDDRDIPAGEKFADADLIGIPVRLVVSEKTGDKIEWKERDSNDSKLLSFEEAAKLLDR
ncbi:MAG: Prolyl-tRNA synthetase [Candidatus Woesebacteria bacterium GW2011_GWB1_41_10]|uniref:Proline--tRNA ligase n=1 Tax=Candidatus Woesebacteria bacterium GW2011_GWB1_41_10 TaxID=1618577 RepID=A0A0G0UFW5_9BACT|nr:MAG: Prolyl-tRNA synthetase [Candidatus Woesebacteria bacterium GW2011_GWB1_41_10]